MPIRLLQNMKMPLTLAFLLLIALLTPHFHAGATPKQVYHWKHYTLAKGYFDKGKYAEAAHELEHAVAIDQSFASYYLLLAKTYEKMEKYQLASDNYYKTSKLYYKTDYNAAIANKNRGDALNTQVELLTYEANQSPPFTKLAKHEPKEGLYIGAFVEYDEAIGPRNVAAFNDLTGKQHAIYFTYHRYGAPFPVNWANQVKEAGGAIQLAYEPSQGLESVKDDAYLRQFARDCAAFGAPIFLRYASEMNGYWAKWHGNPKLYIEKFRLVHKVMREEAPNVAMVWAPAAAPINKIDEYYPGDAHVDWVGVNMYSVRFFNGDIKQPADQLNPLDKLDYVYKQYSARKPIMIAETGATHFSAAGNMDTTNFSITKMNMLYYGVKMKYPRLKAIHWFSVNTLKRVENPERRLNNFSLSENAKVLAAYKSMIKDPYFLSSVTKNNAVSTTTTAKVSGMVKLENRTVKGVIKGHAWIKTYDPYIKKVTYNLDGKLLGTETQYPYRFTIDTAKLSSGKHKLQVLVYDSKNRLATSKTVSFSR